MLNVSSSTSWSKHDPNEFLTNPFNSTLVVLLAQNAPNTKKIRNHATINATTRIVTDTGPWKTETGLSISRFRDDEFD